MCVQEKFVGPHREGGEGGLSRKGVLARIRKGFVREFRDADLETIERERIVGTPLIQKVPLDRDVPDRILGTVQEDTTLDEGKAVSDIRFVAKPLSGRTVTWVPVNVELQNEFHHQPYGKIKKGYSVWICTDPTVKRRNTANSYGISERHFRGRFQEPKKNYGLQSQIMICLGDLNPCEAEDALRFLDVLFDVQMGLQEKNTILEQEFGMTGEADLKEEVNKMRIFRDVVYSQGAECGEERGVKQNRESSIRTL